jgi:hypothetical protein
MKDFITEIFKKAGHKVDSKAAIAESFFVLQGIFVGVALNDIWRMLNLPGNNAPINVAGVNGSFDQDFLYQLIIATASGAAQVLFKVDHGISFGAGIALGSTWANTSEKGQYIGASPAQAKGPDVPPGLPQTPPGQPIMSSLSFPGPYGMGNGTSNSPMTTAPAQPYNPTAAPRLNQPTLT